MRIRLPGHRGEEESGVPVASFPGSFAPPVPHQHVAKLADRDVPGFQIAVQRPFAVGKSNGVADLAEDKKETLKWKFTEGVRIFFLQILEDRPEGAALHLLHRIKQGLPILPDRITDGLHAITNGNPVPVVGALASTIARITAQSELTILQNELANLQSQQ